ncbi:thiopurine S-methyltransferase [Pseudomonas capeferrum]|uniref:thiopurine S-methyltransferase n=1 Tax=Pseudomonas capeferrum TaxID=1495066 RepID=UPI0015E33607|nr:thiopurine S-methyltransferase [Pseudomonas capeferrum]MBA1205045.1 thiopurine S-methyltransferase [Pseudomonas capeferrum]
MESAFWNKRWEDNQIGFHQSQVNPYLQTHWPRLELTPASRVLVPLCGKSLDMIWLAAQGYRVRGVELAERAVLDFFHEQGLEAEVFQHGAFTVWRSGEIELWQGDIFDLQPSDVDDCEALFDRAALIALPPAMRERYLRLLSTILPPTCKGLLVTLDYDQARVDGPPFSVADEEVRRGFDPWHVEEVEQVQIIEQSPKFSQAGVPSLLERVYRVSR